MVPRFFSIVTIFRPSLIPGFGFFPAVMSNEARRRAKAPRARWKKKLVIAATICVPLIRLDIEEGTLLFFWENYDGRQRVACREGQRLEFVDRGKVDSLPKQSYLTDVFDLALAAQKRANVAAAN